MFPRLPNDITLRSKTTNAAPLNIPTCDVRASTPVTHNNREDGVAPVTWATSARDQHTGNIFHAHSDGHFRAQRRGVKSARKLIIVAPRESVEEVASGVRHLGRERKRRARIRVRVGLAIADDAPNLAEHPCLHNV